MKNIVYGLCLVPLALATSAASSNGALSSLPTIKSTVISTASCLSGIAPSQFRYSNYSSFDSLSTSYPVVNVQSSSSAGSSSSASSKGKSTIYDNHAVTEASTVQVTKTICDASSSCYVTTGVQSLTTYTATTDGILTVITTVLPSGEENSNLSLGNDKTVSTASPNALTTASPSSATSSVQSAGSSVSASASSSAADKVEGVSTATAVSHTLITITSCKDNKCTEIPHTTGVSVVTTTVDDHVTSYTTWCPLSGESSSEALTVSPSETSLTAQTSETVPASQSAQTSQAGTTKEQESVSTAATTTPSSTSSAPAVTIPTSKSAGLVVAAESQIPTINVITGNIATETTLSTLAQQTSTSMTPSSAPSSIAHFEAAAARNYVGQSIIAVLAIIVLAAI